MFLVFAIITVASREAWALAISTKLGGLDQMLER